MYQFLRLSDPTQTVRSARVLSCRHDLLTSVPQALPSGSALRGAKIRKLRFWENLQGEENGGLGAILEAGNMGIFSYWAKTRYPRSPAAARVIFHKIVLFLIEATAICFAAKPISHEKDHFPPFLPLYVCPFLVCLWR